MTKQELAQAYNISRETLRKLLNKRYFEELSKLGYRKEDNYLSPCVIRKFYELYGEPLND